MEAVNYTILVVEDEKDILYLIEYNLKNAGFQVLTSRNGQDGLSIALKKKPDLILLDLMLPELEGIEVCKVLKRTASTCNIPILMVTAKGEERDRVKGLEIGAEDYIVKPFSPRELVLRVKAVLKRLNSTDRVKFRELGPIWINQEDFEVKIEGTPVILTTTEFKLLRELMQRPGHVFSRETLLNHAWGADCYVTERTVDTHIRRLRKKMNSAGKWIESIRGIGYKIKKNNE